MKVKILTSLFLIFNLQFLSAGILDSIRNTPRDQMPEIALLQFNEHIIHKDSAEAVTILGDILQYAKNTSHRRLEIMAMGLKQIFTYRFYLFHIPGADSSIISGLKEVTDLAREEKFPIEEARFTHHLGFVLFRLFGNASEGLACMLKANNMMLRAGYDKIPGVEGYLYRLATVYFNFRNFEKALQYIEETRRHAPSGSLIHISSLNLAGIIHGENGNLEKALESFKRMYEIVKGQKDSAGIGIAYGNMATIYLDLGNTDTAEALLNRAYHLDTLYNKWPNAISALFRMSELYLKKKEPEEAGRKLDLSFKLMKNKRVDDHIAWQEYYTLKRDLASEMKMFEEAHLYGDSLFEIKSELARKRDANMLANLSAQVTAEKYLTNIELLENERKVQQIIRNSLLSIAVIIILFLGWLFYSQKKKRQQEKKTFLARQEKAEESLRNFRDRILDKNRLIEKFREQLEEQKAAGTYTPNEDIIHQLNQSIILTEEDWHEFKKLFENVYPGFLQKMQLEHPSLTIAEIRLLALTKLNLSVTEMANMLGILPQSVRKTRQRLMKKLHIEHHKKLPLFLTGK